MDEKNSLQGPSNLPQKRSSNDLSVASVFKSQDPTFQSMIVSGGKLQLAEFLIDTIDKFIKLNYPNTLSIEVAKVFAKYLLDHKPDWKQKDVEVFFQFILTNQSDDRFKIFGSSFLITPVKLIEYVSYYENDKSAEREVIIYSRKEPKEVKEKADPEVVKGIVENMLRKIHQNPTPPIPSIKIQEKPFDPLLSALDFEIMKKSIPQMSKADKKHWKSELMNQTYIANQTYFDELIRLLS